MKKTLKGILLLAFLVYTSVFIPNRLQVRADELTTVPLEVPLEVPTEVPTEVPLEVTPTVEAETFITTIDVTSKKYGAKAGKDCTEAIQKALDVAAKKATSTKRAMVYIPKGRYYISRPLRIDSNIYLKCDPKAVINEKGNRCLFMLRSEKHGKGKYKNTKNITVEGGIWDAKFKKFNKDSGGSLFFFAHTTNIEIINVELKNNYGTHLIELGAVDGITIKGCKLHGFMKSPRGDDKEAIQLDIAKNYEVLPDASPYDDTPCKNVTITNNEIYDYPRAIGSHTSVKGVYYDTIRINQNDIHDVSAEAIYAFNYTNLTVEDNVIHNAKVGVVLKSFSPEAPHNLYNRKKGVKATYLDNYNYNVLIQNNTITTKNLSVTKSPVSSGVFIYGTDKYPIKGCTVLNNTIKSSSSGVYFKYVGSSTFRNNTITRLNDSKGTGKTAAFVVDAIKLQNSSNNSIDQNTVNVNGSFRFENGIAIREKSNNNKMMGNQIGKVVKNGIGVYVNSSATISENAIRDAGMHGITIVGNSNANIETNTVDNSTGNGITIVDNSSAMVSGNRVSSNGAHGISSSRKSTVSVTNNTVSGNAGTGIILSDSIVQALTNNIITDNKGKGLGILNATAPSVTGNMLSNQGVDWEITATSSKTEVGLLSPITINSITAGSTSISGIARNGTTVCVTIGDKEYTTIVAKNVYHITIPAQQAGATIKVISKDALGNGAFMVTTVK